MNPLIKRTQPDAVHRDARALFAAIGCAGASLLAAAGCTTAKDAAVPQVRVRAAEDLECPSTKIQVVAELGGRYRATGCGRTAVYHTVCEHLSCRVGLEGEAAPAWRDRPDPGSIEEGR